MAETKIQIKNLTVVYGKDPAKACALLQSGKNRHEIFQSTGMTVAVQDVSLDIYQKEILVIMGLSGSGKSTLLKCLNLLLRPCQGSILVDGENILDYNKKQLREYRQKKTCMVFQEYGLLPHRTVLQNVEFGLEVAKKPKDSRRKIAQSVIDTVGLSGWENSYPHSLSGGMQQRVGLARALTNQPDVLLMDEPFSALDPLIRRQMQQELLELQTKLNKVIVFITHDINEAFYLGDRVAIMKDASLEQVGTPNEIIHQPATEYVAEFIKDVNRLQVIRLKSIMEPCQKAQPAPNQPRLQANLSLGTALKQLPAGTDLAWVIDEHEEICGQIHRQQIIENLLNA
jgi:glycine betaine/proline transport system ATP-binding protein